MGVVPVSRRREGEFISHLWIIFQGRKKRRAIFLPFERTRGVRWENKDGGIAGEKGKNSSRVPRMTLIAFLYLPTGPADKKWARALRQFDNRFAVSSNNFLPLLSRALLDSIYQIPKSGSKFSNLNFTDSNIHIYIYLTLRRFLLLFFNYLELYIRSFSEFSSHWNYF